MLKSFFPPRGAWRQVLISAALLALLIALFMLLFDAIGR